MERNTQVYPWTNNGPTAISLYFTQGKIVINQGYYWLQSSAGVWSAVGTVKSLWPSAQAVDGIYPWDNNGPKTLYPGSAGTLQVINQGKYWAIKSDGSVSSSGRLSDSGVWGTLNVNNKVNGTIGMLDNNGPSAVSVVSADGTLVIMNNGAYWYLLNGSIKDSGALSVEWAGTPTVGSDGYHSYSDNGPTTLYLKPDNATFLIINNGRWWSMSTSAGWNMQGTIMDAWGPSNQNAPGITVGN